METEEWNRRGVTEYSVEGRRCRGAQANPRAEPKSDSMAEPPGEANSAGNHVPEKIR